MVGRCQSADMEPGGLGVKFPILGLITFQRYPEGAGEDQAEHLHEALAVHPVLAVIQADWIGLSSGYSYKILHIPDRAEMYHKFFAIFHLALYKPFCFVYNGEESRNSPLTQLYQIM